MSACRVTPSALSQARYSEGMNVKLPSERKALPPAVTSTDPIPSRTVATTKSSGCASDAIRITKPALIARACAKTPSGASCEWSSAMSIATGTIAAASHSDLPDTSASTSSGTSANMARLNARPSNTVSTRRKSDEPVE